MTEQFDPYRKWLGISPKDRPPHHYRLLGIPLYEDDLDVIENAADRQMAHVRTYQSGQHAAASQKILNELSTAKLCLLDPEKKPTYDAELKARLAPAVAAPPKPAAPAQPPRAVPMHGPPDPMAAAPVSPAVAVSTSPVSTSPAPQQPVVNPQAAMVAPSVPIKTGDGSGTATSRVRSRRKSAPPMLLIGGGAAVLIIALLGVVMALSKSGDPKDDQTSKDDKADAASFDPVFDDTLRGRDRRPTDRRPPRRPPRRPQPEPLDTDFGLPDPEDGTDDSGTDGTDFGFNVPTPAERMRQSLADVRQALASRDIKLARRHFIDADDTQATAGRSDELEQARVVLMYYEAFGRAAQRGAGSIKADTEFQLGGRTVTMVSVRGDTINYNDGTADQQIRFAELSQEDALAFARRTYDPDDALGKLHTAAFLALDDQGDRDANLAAAKQLWHEASDGGIANPELAHELGIYDDVAVQPPPPDDGAPATGPPPFAEFILNTSDDGADGAGTPQRTAVPDSAALKSARARVNSSYRAQIAASRFPAEKSAMAKTIFEAALAEKDDEYRYALLEKARDFAVELAVPEALVGIVDEMATDFDIDPMAEKAACLNRAIMSAGTVQQNADIFKYARDLFEQALEEGQYETAADLADTAVRVARKTKNYGSLKSAEEQLERVKPIVQDKQRADAARGTLANDPDDPRANEALGRYLCFYEEDWQGGLSHLAKAADEELQQLAATEVDQPSEAAEQTALADAWLALGEKTGDLTGDAMRRRALSRFRHIAPFLDGEEKIRVDDQIRKLGDEFDPKPEPPKPKKKPAKAPEADDADPDEPADADDKDWKPNF